MNIKHNFKSRVVTALFTAAALATATNVFAVPYYYTDWESWNPGAGTASGIITPSSGSIVTVNFDAITSTGSNGSFLGVAGSSLWTPVATYQSTQVDNAPGPAVHWLDGAGFGITFCSDP